jgi:hypothetical protein
VPFFFLLQFYLGLDFLLEMSQNQAPHSSRHSTSGKAHDCIRTVSLGKSIIARGLTSFPFPVPEYGIRKRGAYQ